MSGLLLPSEAYTEALGARIARWAHARPGTVRIYLDGDLGAGKTTLVRGALTDLGHLGPVRSPTYTLVEPYHLRGRAVLHMDLYRISDPEELEWLGIRDVEGESALWWVEWPGRGAGWLPPPDLRVRLSVSGGARAARLEGNAATIEEFGAIASGKWLES